MTDRVYAKPVKAEDSNMWRVFPMTAGFLGFMPKDKAVAICDALNTAYEHGRAEIQSELRSLIGAAREE